MEFVCFVLFFFKKKENSPKFLVLAAFIAHCHRRGVHVNSYDYALSIFRFDTFEFLLLRLVSVLALRRKRRRRGRMGC